MFTTATSVLRRPLRYAAALLAISAVSACAQMPFFGSDKAQGPEQRPSTLTEAQEKARGGRDRGHASSQVSLGFGGTKTGTAPATEAALGGIHELAQPQTFIGTIACGPTNASCIPVRLVITLHPNGVWRLRASGMDPSRTPTVDQGCWHQIGSHPNRIVLQTQNDTVLTDLSFTNPNQVRVNVFNYVNPKLETHLSRQPDVDSISELENQTGPICRP